MGRKMIRDFVPGMRLAGEGPINGEIQTADTPAERLLLGAEKIVEEAQELLEAVQAQQAASSRQDVADQDNEIRQELGDVHEAMQYFANVAGLNAEDAARSKRESHGGFSKHFVWEWPEDPVPSVMLSNSIVASGFGVRIVNCLESENINTVQDLMQYAADDLFEIRNLGLVSLNDIKMRLARDGLVLPSSTAPEVIAARKERRRLERERNAERVRLARERLGRKTDEE